MSEIKNAVDLRLLNGEKEAFIEISTMESINTDNIINKAFAFVGDTPAEITENRLSESVERKFRRKLEPESVDKKPFQGVLQENELVKDKVSHLVEKMADSKIRPKQLPLLSKSERTSYPIKDAFADKPQKERVQVFYHCPQCHHSDYHTVPYGFRFVKCANCSEKLFLRPAADSWGEKDDAGNTYVAEEVYQGDGE